MKILLTLVHVQNQVSALVGSISSSSQQNRKRKSTAKKPAAKRRKTSSKSSSKKRKSTSKRKTVKKKRSTRAPGQPRKNLSSYFIWMQENRQRIKSRYPGLNLAEFAKKAGEIWSNIGDKSVSFFLPCQKSLFSHSGIWCYENSFLILRFFVFYTIFLIYLDSLAT